jgi:hypothetical protein
MLAAAFGLLLAACSGARPELVAPPTTASEASATTAPPPPPDRADCETAFGGGAWALDLVADAAPCVAVAAHQRVELINGTGEAIEVTVGQAVVPIAPDASAVTEPAGTILATGPNRLLAGTDPVATLWLVDQAESTVVGAPIGLSSIGGIELGQGPADVTAATGVPVPASGAPCHQTGLPGDPYSPLLTFRDGRLVVVQVFTPGQSTISGVTIGSTSADVVSAYGDRVEAVADPGGDPARQLLVFTPSDVDDQIYRLVFDLTDDRVTSMRFGASEIVAAQPGCD